MILILQDSAQIILEEDSAFWPDSSSDPKCIFLTPILTRGARGLRTRSPTYVSQECAGGTRAPVSRAQPPRQPARVTPTRLRAGGGACRRPAPYIRGLSGGGAAAQGESRGLFLSVFGRLGAGDCWRGAWSLALVPLRLLSRSGTPRIR